MENYQTEIIPEPKKSVRSGCLSFAIDTLETIVLAVVLFLGINAISARVRVENISMLPTLQPGEFLLVNKLAYRIGSPQVGDVIIFHYPKNPEEDYIKRLIGLPGDTVKVTGGTVYVNDMPLTEPYISAPPAYEGSWTVPEGNFFVLGDNRNQSSDSHSWGFVPQENVIGKAIFIYWPLENVKTLSHPAVVNAAQ
ncbi:MAG TPA: signal peptidase I [Anaerolineaceae bacterium]|nr:signal peptidase I [Anaerolineaceae bacterium]